MTDSKRHLHRYVQPAASHRPSTLDELTILQKHHQFIREENGNDDVGQTQQPSTSQLTWEEKLSLSWYNKLFREYALCDLAQYKTGGVAMRWRTEEEVLDRVGELTCSYLDCKYHRPAFSPRADRDEDDTTPLVPKELTPYQLNFRYEEQGKVKQALVKVVLCGRCSRKLTWKKDREREKEAEKLGSRDGHTVNSSNEARRRDGRSRSPEGGNRQRCDTARDKSEQGSRTRGHRTGRSRSRSKSRERGESKYESRRRGG